MRVNTCLFLLRILLQATSNGKYVDSCLDMLVSNFMPPASLVDMLKQPRGQAKKEQVLTRLHWALEAIVDRMPMAALKLSSIVVHKMPRPIRMNTEKDLKYRVSSICSFALLDFFPPPY